MLKEAAGRRVEQCWRHQRPYRNGRHQRRRAEARDGGKRARRLELHEVPAAPNALARRRRNRQLLVAISGLTGTAALPAYIASKR
jgi:hypothetical protein